MNSQQWPEPKENLHIRVLAHKATDTHVISYTADGLLHIEINPATPEEELPDFVRKSAEPGSAIVNHAGIAAVREVLDSVERQIL